MKIVIATLVVLVICSIWIILWATKSKPIIIEQLSDNILSYGAFKQQYFANKNSKIIPKFIFRTFKYHKPEFNFVLNNAIEMNPGFIQIYFSDDDCRDFISTFYPIYLNAFDMITPGAFKADLFRLIILYHFGGVYSDIGHMFLQPMTNFINFDFDECVLVKDLQDGFIQIHNAFMAAYPRHPLIKSMLIHITKNIENKYYGTSPLAITGPDALGVLFSKYYGLHNTKNINSGVYRFYNNRIKFLQLGSSINQNHILDTNKEKVIKTKFDNFKAIVYSDDVLPHYSEIWKNKQVYGEPEPQKHECIIS